MGRGEWVDWIEQDVIDYCRSLKVGDKIKFSNEKQRYTVKAKSNRFLICTKPNNLIHHVWYTIVDLERNCRGQNNFIFNPYDYATQKDIDKCLNELKADANIENLMDGVEVSYRNSIRLEVDIE